MLYTKVCSVREEMKRNEKERILRGREVVVLIAVYDSNLCSESSVFTYPASIQADLLATTKAICKNETTVYCLKHPYGDVEMLVNGEAVRQNQGGPSPNVRRNRACAPAPMTHLKYSREVWNH